MSSDAARSQLGDALDGLRSQIADLAAVHKKRDALMVDGRAAEGAVVVTVDARGQLVGVVIDESYLDDHDFDELAGCVLEAARAAAGAVERRAAEMLAPISQRDKSFPTLSDIVQRLGFPEGARVDLSGPPIEGD